MRILFDQGTPAPLRKILTAHSVETAFERGWNRMRNGELLDVAEAQGFEVLVTTDQRLKHQQNLSDRNIAVVVLTTTSWPRIQRHAEAVVETLASLSPGEYREPSPVDHQARLAGEPNPRNAKKSLVGNAATRASTSVSGSRARRGG